MLQSCSVNSSELSCKKLRIAVLASGSGSNFEALVNYCRRKDVLVATVCLLIVNNPGSGAEARAERLGIPWLLINHRNFDNRELHDAAIANTLKKENIDLVVLAGWMRIITSDLINAFPKGSLLNIHPSLLPAFKGSAAIADALLAGVLKTGCSVHEVVLDVDAGPILAQAEVLITKADDLESLSAKIHQQEHLILAPIVLAKARHLTQIMDKKVASANPAPEPIQP